MSYIADTVLLLRPFEHRGTMRKSLSVYKRRGGPHENTIREFKLAEGAAIVGEPLTEFSGVITGNPQYLGGALGAQGD